MNLNEFTGIFKNFMELEDPCQVSFKEFKGINGI